MPSSPLNKILLCLGLLLASTTPAAAWFAAFYDIETGCSGEQNPEQAKRHTFHNIVCQNLGQPSPDTGVECKYLTNGVSTPSAPCGGQGNFVARSASIRGLEYCVGWMGPDCTGDYELMAIDVTGTCHTGTHYMSFKCLQ
ncbi:Uu.00g108310.m01.CDS01 [Anthostomella pinea]|uniref:Uu.00g108310.m01.CDS01 n=1 Tax=Anthostomella pinea TaxID=933095 RepID=A0AAI8VEG0_9PEZI|nr:Uu.00g108310.m01.CDS01 [Anthostomella pinea]